MDQCQTWLCKNRRKSAWLSCPFKGTVSRDFSLLVFFINQFPPQPQSIPLGPFRIFSKIRGDIRSSRLTTGVADTGGKWEKSSIRKILIILLGHLWIVELTHIYIIAFKLTLKVVGNEKRGGSRRWHMIDVGLVLWWSMSVFLCNWTPSWI